MNRDWNWDNRNFVSRSNNNEYGNGPYGWYDGSSEIPNCAQYWQQNEPYHSWGPNEENCMNQNWYAGCPPLENSNFFYSDNVEGFPWCSFQDPQFQERYEQPYNPMYASSNTLDFRNQGVDNQANFNWTSRSMGEPVRNKCWDKKKEKRLVQNVQSSPWPQEASEKFNKNDKKQGQMIDSQETSVKLSSLEPPHNKSTLSEEFLFFFDTKGDPNVLLSGQTKPSCNNKLKANKRGQKEVKVALLPAKKRCKKNGHKSIKKQSDSSKEMPNLARIFSSSKTSPGDKNTDKEKKEKMTNQCISKKNTFEKTCIIKNDFVTKMTETCDSELRLTGPSHAFNFQSKKHLDKNSTDASGNISAVAGNVSKPWHDKSEGNQSGKADIVKKRKLDETTVDSDKPRLDTCGSIILTKERQGLLKEELMEMVTKPRSRKQRLQLAHLLKVS